MYNLIYIALSLCIVACIAIIYNLMRKVEELEDSVVEQYNESSRINETLQAMQIQMLEIDSTGAFQSDDEVGAVFNQLKQVVDMEKEDINE